MTLRVSQRSRHIGLPYGYSGATAPYSNVSLFRRLQQSIMSPAFAPSGSVISLLQPGQLT